MVTMTERAALKVQALADKKGQAPVLRVKVGAGGCSGMSYEFVVSDELAADDVIFEGHGAKAVVDPQRRLLHRRLVSRLRREHDAVGLRRAEPAGRLDLLLRQVLLDLRPSTP